MRAMLGGKALACVFLILYTRHGCFLRFEVTLVLCQQRKSFLRFPNRLQDGTSQYLYCSIFWRTICQSFCFGESF